MSLAGIGEGLALLRLRQLREDHTEERREHYTDKLSEDGKNAPEKGERRAVLLERHRHHVMRHTDLC